jgi:NADH dehydrogenase FAD-containing subunit
LAAGQPLPELPLASFLQGTGIRFLQGTIEELQAEEKQVEVRTPAGVQPVAYDYLLYALGSFINTRETPGAGQYTHTLDRASTQALADRLPGLAAQGGSLLVVGGGNTGVEVVSEIAEKYPGLKITLATRRSFARNLSPAARTHIRKAFKRLGIRFLEDTAITRVEERSAITAHGERLPFEACIWVGGFAVSDLPKRAGLFVNGRGQILIDRAMRSLSHPEIYAVGDAAYPVDEPGAPTRMGLYTAIMMGAHGADCLAAQILGKPPSAFGLSYVALGVSLGRQDGVFQFLDWDSDTPLALNFTGRLANLTREFFVRFALWSIRMQRTAPWVFDWPGKRKMRSVPVPALPARAESAGQVE